MIHKQKKELMRQWFRKNFLKLIVICILILALFIGGAILENYILIGGNTIFAFVIYIIARNNMLAFLDKNVKDPHINV